MSRIWVRLSGLIAASSVSVVPAVAAEPDASQKSAFDAAMTEADRRFVAGDLTGALELIEPACAGTERADCSFSLGAIHHGLGHCSEALAYYRRYRAVAPRGEHIGEVAAALEEVESRCGDIDAPAVGPDAPAVAPASAAPTSSATTLGPVQGVVPLGPAMAEPPVSSDNQGLVLGSFMVSGAAAATSLVFGILAARSARRCDRARAYDRQYVQECEVDGPRYQGLWQGFALASGGFLGVGLTLWWLDGGSSSASLGVSGTGYPELNYRRTF